MRIIMKLIFVMFELKKDLQNLFLPVKNKIFERIYNRKLSHLMTTLLSERSRGSSNFLKEDARSKQTTHAFNP